MKCAILLVLALVPVYAQSPQRLQSPEVHPDNRVTFRFRAPGAKEVYLAREGAQRVPMRRDEDGVWTVTTDPLEPDIYGYSFIADGVGLIDPSNPSMKPNLLSTQSVVHVRSSASLPWDANNVARGEIHRHFYRSAVVGDDRDFYVYTPPGYDPAAKRLYPVLYLLHGFSDDASGWTAVGRAHVILDNLIAQGKARPMLVVMPLGYGAPEILSRTGPRDPNLGRRNMDKFREALLQEVIPAIEKTYRVQKDRNSRAIAGLSMGGAESLYTGLNNLKTFAWIGSFSAGGLSFNQNIDDSFPGLDSKANAQLRLLWIACGKDDGLIGNHRKFTEWLNSKEIRNTSSETPGAHTWMVWRRYLAEFAPLLFR
jgi:enterochelin esterase-like enzyme